MNHYHVIYTPKGLTDLSEEYLASFTKYVVCYEIGKGGPHYHIYMETHYAEDKPRDLLKEVQKIPTGTKGKKSLHYSLRAVAEHPPDYPTQDLRKFTLGYVQKNEDRKFMKGYSEEELKQALDYYHEQISQRQHLEEQLQQKAVTIIDPDASIQGQWAEYVVFFEKLIKEQLTMANLTPAWFKAKSKKFWRAKNNGLFPQACKYRRFLVSIIDKYRHNFSYDLKLEMYKDCGY